MPRWPTGAVVAVLSLCIMCCAGSYTPQERLTERVDRFNDAMRWGLYQKAALYVRDADRSGWVQRHADWTSDMRIADYDVVDSDFSDDGNTATVRVVVNWYRLSESELQTSMLAQTWRREGRIWELTTERVEEGAPL